MTSELLNDEVHPRARLYGLCGFIGSGKNAVGDVISKRRDTQSLSFAEPLKDAVAAIFGWDRLLLEGKTTESRDWREQVDPFWSKVFRRDVTPRGILQEFGTDVCREWQDNLWIHAIERRIDPKITTLFTDLRFGNEMMFLRRLGGSVVWVYRPELNTKTSRLDQVVATAVTDRAPLHTGLFEHPLDQRHVSEIAFLCEGANFINVVLVNDGSPRRLTRLAQHLDLKLSHPDPAFQGIPWNKTTLYLSTNSTGDFVWEWRGGNVLRPDNRLHTVHYNEVHEYLLTDVA